MSDKPPANGDDINAVPAGTALLAASALRSPAPPPDAEAASTVRALSAYETMISSPRPLQPELWGADQFGSLSARLSRLLRRLRRDQ